MFFDSDCNNDSKKRVIVSELEKLPIIRYLKDPVNSIGELYTRYPDGGEHGWFAFVYNKRTFAYWDTAEKRWQLQCNGGYTATDYIYYGAPDVVVNSSDVVRNYESTTDLEFNITSNGSSRSVFLAYPVDFLCLVSVENLNVPGDYWYRDINNNGVMDAGDTQTFDELTFTLNSVHYKMLYFKSVIPAILSCKVKFINI